MHVASPRVDGTVSPKINCFAIKSPSGEYWQNPKNSRKWLERVKKKLGYKCMDDWYNVTVHDINNNDGLSLLKVYNNSPSKALVNAYPEHNWQLWRFKTQPRSYWDNMMKDNKEALRMMDWLGDKLTVTHLNDWYRVSMQQLQAWVSHINSSTTLVHLLRMCYPQHEWEVQLFSKRDKRSSQRRVFHALQALFPQHG